MKKRLIAILAVASIILTSCANEKQQKEETNLQFYSVTNIEELLIEESQTLKENSKLEISEELYEKLFSDQELKVLTLDRK